MTVDGIAVKGELQLGCDVPCGDDGQARGLAPRDPRSPGGVMGSPHGARSEQEYMKSDMVMKTAAAKSERKAMASSSRLSVRRERERS